ncbi:uncharacterized protein LOC110677081 isoform X1 [Aedes aegypti]|uniref:Uncharacterized protein n=1 Tax=Aedes aegypti TaxID=7159 RepID=A0A6I8TM17_AEDAE|nr:uncharacterized protein LOC110677081 isoform X1 [Aedes aegypti]
MDINLLPTEVLQEIMSYLGLETLKKASLVCHRWFRASEKFIHRKGQLMIIESAANHLNVIRNFVRDYQTICILQMKEWSNLQAVITECSQRLPTVRKLYLVGCLQDYLYRFYNTFRNWVDQCESFQVSLDDRSTEHFIIGPEDFNMTFTNLKTLIWAECLYGQGQKTMILNAPNLENVYINDSLDASAVLRFPICDNIKFIRCVFYTKHFDDTFVGNVSNVENVIVDAIYRNCDISYLVKMHKLRYLRLKLGSASNTLHDIEAMHQCNCLRILSITVQDSSSEKGSLNLEKVFKNFIKLETLDLQGIELKVNDSIQAKQLQFLKLRDVTCSKSAVSLHLPRLKVLTVSVSFLSKLQLNECDYFEELYLDLLSYSLKQSFQNTVIPFFLSHKNLKKLAIFRSIYDANRIEDDALYDCRDLGVEHMELYHLDISIDFFRMISQWTSLKRLTMVACSINCKTGPNNNVFLPYVQEITLDCVKLRDAAKKKFPLKFGGVYKLQSSSIASSLLYSTKRQQLDHDGRYNPFACDEIDPLH